MNRIEEVAAYLGVDVNDSDSIEKVALELGVTPSYLTNEPAPPATVNRALARLGGELSPNDRREAERFATYLSHATDD